MQPTSTTKVEQMAGRRLGIYQLIEIAGRGGMGVVYRAWDTRLERSVAIKIMDPDRTSVPGIQRRFREEARWASAVSHPNLVHIYEVGQEDSLCFIAMEFIEGAPL